MNSHEAKNKYSQFLASRIVSIQETMLIMDLRIKQREAWREAIRIVKSITPEQQGKNLLELDALRDRVAKLSEEKELKMNDLKNILTIAEKWKTQE